MTVLSFSIAMCLFLSECNLHLLAHAKRYVQHVVPVVSNMLEHLNFGLSPSAKVDPPPHEEVYW